MIGGWERRSLSAAGVVAYTAIAVLVANHPTTQSIVTTYVPLARRLSVTVLTGSDLYLAIGLSVVTVFLCLTPLYKPRTLRILDMIFLTEKRVLTAMFALATLGYFNWTYRLPRATLAVMTGLLLVILPLWFVVVKSEYRIRNPQAIIVGDDPDQITRAADALEIPVLGYLSPSINARSEATSVSPKVISDGGTVDVPSPALKSLGGLSRLEQFLTDYDISTVVLAFEKSDRGEFFGVLETCHAHGVEAKVLREHADSVLLSDQTAGELVTIALEPWDWQDRLFKRGFDIAFAGAALIVLSPLLTLIAIAIKLDSPGPVLYSQERTAGLGRTFQVSKFRSMVTDAEGKSGAVLSAENTGNVDPRVTKTGRILRKTHLDEAPQLWSILIGDMSVVGPRPERPKFDSDILANGIHWEKRWFVKPGLTGLAQVNNATGFEPEEKLRWDLEYIRRQSFWFDLKIVIRQLWIVIRDAYKLVRADERSK